MLALNLKVNHAIVFLIGASPYCIIKCGKESVRTPVISETLDPKFDASAIFYLRNVNTAKAIIEVSIISIVSNF